MICLEEIVPAQWEMIEASQRAQKARALVVSGDGLEDIVSLCADALNERYVHEGPIWISLPRMLSADELQALALRLNNRGWSFRTSNFWRLGDYKLKVGALYNNEAFDWVF